MQHLVLAPIVLPLVTGAILLMLERRHDVRVLRSGAWIGLALLLAAAVALVARADGGGIEAYLLGDWPSRLGIALMLDRLSALMVLTTTLLAIPALLYACAGWDRRALHFHALFQIQLAGLNGAFLTGDIFNLFVFFEVMLIASYGLLLSGARGERIAAGMHYVVFNIAASTLFLIALGLLYGMLGSLNMAELAVRVAAVAPEDVALVRVTLGLLLVVFCAKAALLPMYLWLPETYARAPAAVAALFVIMTKVGLYALLRTGSLWFGDMAGPFEGFARGPLLVLGMATMLLGSLGVVGALRLRIAAAYLVLMSAGTLFVAFALAQPGTIAAGLYYLPQSCFAAAALFLVAHIVQRQRGRAGDRVLPTGLALPLQTGLLFMVTALALVGLPPLSGFIGKFLMLAAVPAGDIGWVYFSVLASSLLALVGLSRSGSRLFWRTVEDQRDTDSVDGQPRVTRMEFAATALLLALVVAMSVFPAPVLRYTTATAEQLLAPADYVREVRATTPQVRAP
ncbi:monovalent cation/H+ antiporter subunit D [Luteimonas composti]|uniref:Monovalent cation/H+ antiporter subunit D n=1 Tax=Luteimonas composti TaxID=398257 RepID=A0ABT6MTP5_9GAMM|nr:monovalent cation/H+ antiporter subunit D [Luteimonas composti]MDH7454021.1 monovalent cation/H+ antiporter subunit D [Luteimonas composti]